MAISITSKTSTHNTTASKNRSILYLVIHYTAGTTSKKGSAANTASYFSTTENQASADFIVDDSTIVQYNPDPANRYCWHCGGNKYTTTKGGSLHGVAKNANSIGIEICSTNSTGTVKDANDSTWSFTDAAVAKAVELTKYLMEKYGIDAGHVIRHYDVTGKLCPGIIGWNADSGDESKWLAFKAQLGTAADDGSMTDAEMYAYFKSQGLNDYGVSGLMGNLYAESALAANNLQNTGNTKLGMTDAEYTSAVDGGSYTNFVNDGYGYGLAQWTYYSRKQALLDFMTAAGVSIGHKRKQCEFIMQELSGYASVLKTLKNAASVMEASNAVLTGYEKPADQSESVQTKRAGYGQAYYDKYAGAASTDSGTEIAVSSLPAVPFTVKVIISDLNYRSEGSMSGTVKGQTGKGTFTIVEVNSSGWGRLKSGAGWIYLLNTSYCTIGSTVTESGSSGSSVPYLVRVTISNLNIRKGPGTGYAKTGKYTGKGVFTIVEESSGEGSEAGWGLLKSYQKNRNGWIALDHATKV